MRGRGFVESDYRDFKFITETGDIVIPFWSDKEMNEVYGMQMRNIYEKRFHNQLFQVNPKVWNLPYSLTLPTGSTIYVTESIIDALSTGFKNIISTLGRTVPQEVLDMYKKYNLVFLFDADEAGDKSTLRYSTLGYHCLLHDKSMYDFKDFNKLLELGQSKENIQGYIESHVVSPLKAQMSLKLKNV